MNAGSAYCTPSQDFQFRPSCLRREVYRHYYTKLIFLKNGKLSKDYRMKLKIEIVAREMWAERWQSVRVLFYIETNICSPLRYY
jgi:hypothetical protein